MKRGRSLFRHPRALWFHNRGRRLNTLAVVDSEDSTEVRRKALETALQTHGFLHYSVRDAAAKQCALRLLHESRVWFTNTELSEKMKIARWDTGFRGYYIYEGNSMGDAESSYSKLQSEGNLSETSIECLSIGKPVPNRKEAYSLRSQYIEEHFGVLMKDKSNAMRIRDLHSRMNQFPEHNKDLQHLSEEWFAFCEHVTRSLLSDISSVLDDCSSLLLKSHDKSDFNLELKYYPQSPKHSTLDRVKDHQDLTTLTLLIQDRPNGLEIWDRCQESWIRVDQHTTCEEDTSERVMILVNSGRFLEMWTDGRFPATPHRVVADCDDRSDRVSIVNFIFPNWECPVNPLPSCVREGSPSQGTIAGHEMPSAF